MAVLAPNLSRAFIPDPVAAVDLLRPAVTDSG
jgi:hypothetical protein